MTSISYREIGSGDTLVLIHGFCESGRIWEKFGQALSANFRVIIPDLPGFGSSPLPAVPFSIDDVAGHMLGWLDDINVPNPVVIGHSLGGYVTLAMAAKEPKRFPGFGLLHSTAAADSEEKKANRNRTIDFVRRYGVQPFIDTFVPGLFYQKENSAIDEVHAIASATTLNTLIGYSEAMRDRPSREKLLETFQGPVLLIAGNEDTIIPIEMSLAQSRLPRFPVFQNLTDVGHMGMFENTPASLKIVIDFMKSAQSLS